MSNLQIIKEHIYIAFVATINIKVARNNCIADQLSAYFYLFPIPTIAFFLYPFPSKEVLAITLSELLNFFGS